MITGRDIPKSLPKQYFGKLFIGGTICAVAFKYVLGDKKLSIFPTVHAAPPPEGPPQKPKKMKFKDLPLYGETPVQKYREYNDNIHKCPEKDKKLLRENILPYVSNVREMTDTTLCKVYYTVADNLKCAYDTFEAQKKELKTFARDPKIEPYRKVFVGTSTLLAFYLAFKRRGHYHKGFFWGGLTALFTGWLCFPCETDKRFRAFCYDCLLLIVRFYNFFCGFNVKLGYGPCETVPPQPMTAKEAEQQKLCPPKPKKPAEKPPPPKVVPKPPPKDPGTEDFECPYD